MLIHPQFDPIAISIGPLAVRWYGLMYLAGFVAFLWLGRRRAAAQPWHGMTAQDIDDLLFYGVLGVVLGGRLGLRAVLQAGLLPCASAGNPRGMEGRHGLSWRHARRVRGDGAVGAASAGKTFLQVTDFIAPLVPLGLAAGRIGNFINGELWGRVADADAALGDGLSAGRPRCRAIRRSSISSPGEGAAAVRHPLAVSRASRVRRGAVSGMFLIGYGVLRFRRRVRPRAGQLPRPAGVRACPWVSGCRCR